MFFNFVIQENICTFITWVTITDTICFLWVDRDFLCTHEEFEYVESVQEIHNVQTHTKCPISRMRNKYPFRFHLYLHKFIKCCVYKNS